MTDRTYFQLLFRYPYVIAIFVMTTLTCGLALLKNIVAFAYMIVIVLVIFALGLGFLTRSIFILVAVFIFMVTKIERQSRKLYLLQTLMTQRVQAHANVEIIAS
eukprot:TRINITY_DN5288_c0_g1_i1.p2 TRINITY_DN5288_c0_g1~~TRINITY_DN5288_c0_g1_i1.p2  ORF type:complete len:104 (-),score=20.17 TRINITY_DN5288_c0_g1_i1:23-334(-)